MSKRKSASEPAGRNGSEEKELMKKEMIFDFLHSFLIEHTDFDELQKDTLLGDLHFERIIPVIREAFEKLPLMDKLILCVSHFKKGWLLKKEDLSRITEKEDFKRVYPETIDRLHQEILFVSRNGLEKSFWIPESRRLC